MKCFYKTAPTKPPIAPVTDAITIHFRLNFIYAEALCRAAYIRLISTDKSMAAPPVKYYNTHLFFCKSKEKNSSKTFAYISFYGAQ